MSEYLSLVRLEPGRGRAWFTDSTQYGCSISRAVLTLDPFNTEQMNQSVFAFRPYEDSSLSYTGIDSHENLAHYGPYDTVVAKE